MEKFKTEKLKEHSPIDTPLIKNFSFRIQRLLFRLKITKKRIYKVKSKCMAHYVEKF